MKYVYLHLCEYNCFLDIILEIGRKLNTASLENWTSPMVLEMYGLYSVDASGICEGSTFNKYLVTFTALFS